ncbi:MAG TPA: acyl-CoA dehydrogenase family protein [Thermoanaerobaculia bacterium]|nr:acyl-CoA dehydrogenase family protein [Thermoanaerobaculia bacterium]
MFDVLLSDPERRLRDEVRAFVRDRVPPSLLKEMDADRIRYPREFVEAMGDANLLGLRFPRDVGGRGLGWVAEMAALEEVGVLGSALGCAFAMPSIVGEALNAYGTPDQKERYLRPLLAGRMVAAEALTEPRGGSDFFGATTTARRDGDVFVLNGAKRFVVGAEGADLFLVYAKTDPEAKPHKSLSVFLVERAFGVEVLHVYGLMGTRGGGTGRIVFRDLRVPASNLVGPLHAGGEIFNRMMVPERMTSAGGALGSARAALEVAARYSDRRKAFGRPIREFEAVSFKIADSIALLDSARALAYVAARQIDAGLDARRLVSETKRSATEAAWTVVNHALQILGGIGYTDVYPIERLLRDVRLMMIWTGSNEIMNLLIQHEYYREVLERTPEARDVEQDANTEAATEKVYE